jgi:hypothetical protein
MHLSLGYAALLFPVVIIKTDHEDRREGLKIEGLEEEGLKGERQRDSSLSEPNLRHI